MIKKIFDSALVLESDRLILRPLKNSDAEDLFEVFSDRDVMKYYDVLPFNDIKEAEKQVDFFINAMKEKSMLRWGIELKENNKLIGTCGFFAFSEDSKKAEMGYELNKAYWNKGIMTEAINLILNHIFNETDINRIEAFVEIPNIASQKLLEKAGFKKEGVLRQYELCRGELIDITLWGLLRADLTCCSE